VQIQARVRDILKYVVSILCRNQIVQIFSTSAITLHETTVAAYEGFEKFYFVSLFRLLKNLFVPNRKLYLAVLSSPKTKPAENKVYFNTVMKL
jgi:hypothetical protein